MREGRNNVSSLAGTRRLADAVRQAKIAAAQRSDVVVDIREADRARLEILQENLKPLLDELDPTDDYFDFTLSGGSHPRLWIDGTASVLMARDRRTYRLVRETRLGRITLAEAGDVGEMADRVTDYVAERIVEREKAFALDDNLSGQGVSRALAYRTEADAPLRAVTQPQSDSKAPKVLLAACLFMLGVTIGAGGLFALAVIRGVAVF